MSLFCVLSVSIGSWRNWREKGLVVDEVAGWFRCSVVVGGLLELPSGSLSVMFACWLRDVTGLVLRRSCWREVPS